MHLQQVEGLLRGEGQLGTPDLRQRAGHPVAVQREHGFGAGDEDQPQPLPGVVQHELQLLRDLGRAHAVVLVEHDGRRLVTVVEFTGDRRQHPVVHAAGVRRAGGGVGQRHPADAQGLQEIRPEHAGPLLVRLDGEPGDRPVQVCGPVGDQQGLARAGRAVDHGQRSAQSLVEVPVQPLPPQERARPGRQSEPGAQEGVPQRIDASIGRRRRVLLECRHGAHHHCPSSHGQRSLASGSHSFGTYAWHKRPQAPFAGPDGPRRPASPDREGFPVVGESGPHLRNAETQVTPGELSHVTGHPCQ